MNLPALPAHLQRLAGRGLADAAMGGLSSGGVNHVSIRMNRFTLVDAAGNKQPLQSFHMDAVIVDANPHMSKIYYKEAFDPNAEDFKPPVCFSDNGLAPSRQAQEPQNKTCSDCPLNAWGSDVSRVTGKRTKACNDVKKIAIFRPEDPSMVFLLRVPPASLKLLGGYIKTLIGNNVEPSMMITRISFDPQTQGVLNFSAVNWIDEKQAARVNEILDAKGADTLVGKDDQPFTGQVTAQPAAQQLAAPQQASLPPPPVIQATQPVQQGYPARQMPTPHQQFVPPQQTLPPWNTAEQAAPAPAEAAPKKPRGRPKKAETEQQPMPAQAPFMQAAPPTHPFPQPVQQRQEEGPPNPTVIPAFLQPQQAAPPPAQGGFPNMQTNAPAPSADLQAALAAALNLPTPG